LVHLKELVEPVEVLQLVEDPGLLDLEHHAPEELSRHLEELRVLAQIVVLINELDVMGDDGVIDEEGDFTDKVELTLDVLLSVRFLIHFFIIELTILLIIIFREGVWCIGIVLLTFSFFLIVGVFITILPASVLLRLCLLDFLLLVRFDHENLTL